MDIHGNLPFLLCLTVLLINVCGAFSKPEFNVEKTNITVLEGGTAILPCAIVNLGDHKVVWTNMHAILLTYQDRRLIDDTRISVERPYSQDWNLHIRDVLYTDRGRYSCSINTNPVMNTTVNLDVKVPPKIIEELSSSGYQTVEEGRNLDLVCNMTGVPEPVVKWYFVSTWSRELVEVVQSSGDVFTIQNVSRYDDGTYKCVGSNGLEVAVSMEINVNVQFAPKVKLSTKYPGRDTTLECLITANPLHDITWMKNGSSISLYDSSKYQLEEYREDKIHSKTAYLRIMDLQHDDYGEYICFSKNYLGQDQASVILKEAYMAETTTTPTMETTGEQVTVTSSTPRDRENATERNNKTATPPSEAMIEAAQLEYYREQILTNRKWRQLMDTEKTFYEAIIKFLQQKEKENLQ
ncbi:limbic system-associated membrane protein-like [Mercenaria mercenaria]|uniref:limbic system-associated membrane protein-like n=1 Tax=Mercenaria mercenaria TaxID=6596 RepID=UPI00234EB846|nr:limbic system-associated membrane protein-like [Mercenaria mercenaria]